LVSTYTAPRSDILIRCSGCLGARQTISSSAVTSTTNEASGCRISKKLHRFIQECNVGLWAMTRRNAASAMNDATGSTQPDRHTGPLHTVAAADYATRMATVTVTDLVLNFADACRALVPSLDRAGVPWGDGAQYDSFDRVAEALFESLVMEPCAFAAAGSAGLSKLRTARYGFSHDNNFNAWVAVHVQGDIIARMILLSSITAPFAHVRCEDPVGLVPLEGKRFMFVYNVGDGNRQLQAVDLTVD
jgi:hypothetical protein